MNISFKVFALLYSRSSFTKLGETLYPQFDLTGKFHTSKLIFTLFLSFLIFRLVTISWPPGQNEIFFMKRIGNL